jgi:hypothetical protein
MKVKIGNKIYDSEDQPIMLILTDFDKNNISNMLETNTKYCSYPANAGLTVEEIEKFMEV